MSEVLRTFARSTLMGTAMVCGIFVAIAFCGLPVYVGIVVGCAVAGEVGLYVGMVVGSVICVGLAMGLLDGLVAAESTYDRRKAKEAERE